MTKTEERRGKRRLRKVIVANIESRQTRVGELYCEGKTMAAISVQLKEEGFDGCSVPSVCLDLKAVRALWEERRVQNYDTWISEELAKLDRLEERLNIAYEKSCENAVEVTVMKSPPRLNIKLKNGDTLNKKQDKKPKVTQEITKTKGQYGDTSILAEIRAVISKRCELLGLIDNRTVNVNQNTQTVDLNTLFGRRDDPQIAAKRVPVIIPTIADPIEEQIKQLEERVQTPENTS